MPFIVLEVCDTALMEFPDDLKCVLYFSSQLSRLLDASELSCRPE